jgi:LmbE family N-acetylglucosaminyl deacetylase
LIGLRLPDRGGRPLKVLCLGAHCDDIEIGAGGTVLRLLRENPGTEVLWVVFSSTEERRAEAQACAQRFLAGAGKGDIRILGFRDGFLPYAGAAVKEAFEDLKTAFVPDLILTHYRHDLHQDHRQVCELTWNTWRNHLILEYEIPKWDGDMGIPNFFVPLEEADLAAKIAALMDCYVSQRGKSWFTEDTFRALPRLRGMECNAPSRHAEAFHCRKAALSLA